jgi:hypothetical protein
VSGNPRNDVLLDQTFLTVEREDGADNWVVVHTDSDWETR